MSDEILARISDGDGGQREQSLLEHLQGVAALASEFADAFGSAEWGSIIGLWHDVGKASPEFQRRLRGEAIKAEHSGAGAYVASQKCGALALPIAFAIAAHHTGLANLVQSGPNYPKPLRERIEENRDLCARIQNRIPEQVLKRAIPALPAFLGIKGIPKTGHNEALCVEFWIRMLFSALVDADRLDAERFDDASAFHLRKSRNSIEDLLRNLEDYLTKLPANGSESVQSARKEILQDCIRAAALPPGIFSLTAPTGGGKTMSAMAFALRHCREHGLRRVIVVIPYTSIIEQNAEKYRDALGAENVVEHHSTFEKEKIIEIVGEEEASRMDKAVENWDAPIIVTTTVQFFETLFSNSPARCRKLHNVAKSVIILDEVQTLPPEYLSPITDALNELAANYGCSIVLSTATPPALKARENQPDGLRNVREIVSTPRLLAERLKRVSFEWEIHADASWEALAERVASEKQILTIVNTRAAARELAERLKRLTSEAAFHLSALMCPAHRRAVLAEVRDLLKKGAPCRVASTQLVEAGVDFDFPVVFKALSGLDSVFQAAGRCNREGRLATGRCVVFRSPSAPPPGLLRKALQCAEVVLAQRPSTDLADPAIFEEYFRGLYYVSDKDRRQIQVARSGYNFAQVAAEFKIIDDGFTHSIVVPYREARTIIARIVARGPSREDLRALQQYVVAVREREFALLSQHGKLISVTEEISTLGAWACAQYDDFLGLVCADMGDDPAGLVT
ncbi:MAG: CRISPR-associated helicase Cas3' [Candidatus Brocadiia bacterium]